jgi:hypothetical protein
MGRLERLEWGIRHLRMTCLNFSCYWNFGVHVLTVLKVLRSARVGRAGSWHALSHERLAAVRCDRLLDLHGLSSRNCGAVSARAHLLRRGVKGATRHCAQIVRSGLSKHLLNLKTLVREGPGDPPS